MAKLVYNNKEMGWECSHCGTLYSDDEVRRMFGYNLFMKSNFSPSYCMDCGILFEDVEMSNS